MGKGKSTKKGPSQALSNAAKALSLTTDAAKKTSPPSPPPPKGKEELELEKLVFGDLTGFQEALRVGLDEDEEERERKYIGVESSEGEDDEGGIKGNEDLNAVHDDELFFFDTGVSGAGERDVEGDLDLLSGEVVKAVGVREEEEEVPKPAWEDSDDERVVVSLMSQSKLKKYRETFTDDVVSGTDYIRRLRTQFERVYPVPAWAQTQSQQQESKHRRVGSDASGSEIGEDEDGEDTTTPSAAPLSDLLQSTSGYITRSTTATKLKPGHLNIIRLLDANLKSPAQSAATSLSFHPMYPILLTSGFDHTLRLYHIDAKTNPAVSSIYIPSVPITTAAFHSDGRRVFFSGRRPYYHIWDLETGTCERIARVFAHGKRVRSIEYFKLSPCGSYLAVLGAGGQVHILSASTAQWVATAHVDGQVVDFVWYNIGPTTGLTIANKAGELFEYDITARAISARWLDEGGVHTSKIALSGGANGDRFIAVGSNSGVVNIYDRTPIMKGTVEVGKQLKPIKALGHLVTRIGSLEFSPDGQVLAMASRAKKDALRLVHIPTCTVFSNWPTSATPLGKVETVAWARGGMLSVGNEAGKVRLWDIRP
ncbi:WD40 repeat-like protein [Terfezia boudieri ATCC MYA-4762]|uniref:WD40 repeat-like protein n=1 Tax=Terfezia boudieri ATCC MYA-4762 TaxID=1051890 RepID=A0A3N4LAJ5_9PEZI|nr:WD40 repeat-like protein [Terfezia boudieri ATCC MYA-4762]